MWQSIQTQDNRMIPINSIDMKVYLVGHLGFLNLVQ